MESSQKSLNKATVVLKPSFKSVPDLIVHDEEGAAGNSRSLQTLSEVPEDSKKLQETLDKWNDELKHTAPSSELLAEFQDDKLFPGYNFQTTEEAQLQEEEAKNYVDEDLIIQKHSQGGHLSSFKGTKEIKDLKQRSLLKKEVQLLWDRLRETQSILESKLQSLENQKEIQHSSKENLDKISIELNEMVTSAGLPSIFNDQNRYKLNDFPKDQKLTIQGRYRELIKFHAVHSKLLATSQTEIPKLTDEILNLRLELQDLQSLEYSLKPFIEQMQVDDQEDFNELLVVAKHRNLEYKKKVREIAIKEESASEEVNRKQILEEDETKRAERDLRMEKFLMESTAREKARQAMVPERHSHDVLPKKVTIVPPILQALPSKPVPNAESKKMGILKKVLDLEFPLEQSRPKSLKSITDPIDGKVQSEKGSLSAAVDPEEGEGSIKEKMKQIECEYSEKPQVTARKHIPVVRVKPIVKDTSKNLRESKEPFKFEPKMVFFQDCMALTCMEVEVKLINCSGFANGFKLLPIPPQLAENVSVEYVPCGKLSNGGEVIVKITFHASNAFFRNSLLSFTSELQFAAQHGGNFSLPLRFSPAVCIPKFHSVVNSSGKEIDFIKQKPKELFPKPKLKPDFAQLKENQLDIDFGACVFGNLVWIQVKIINEGGVGSPIQFLAEHIQEPELLESNRYSIKSGDFELVYGDENLKPRCPLMFRINFKPVQAILDQEPEKAEESVNGKSSCSFTVNFSPLLAPFIVSCSGIGKSLPIYSSRTLFNFQWCLPNVPYQDQIILHNNYRMSRKFAVDFGEEDYVSKDLSKTVNPPDFGSVEVSPCHGFILPGGQLQVWVKVQFSKALAKEFEEIGREELSYSFAIRFVDPSTNVEGKIPIKLVAKVLTFDIKLQSGDDQSVLDFGGISCVEQKELKLKITNESKFRQIVQCNDGDNFRVIPASDDPSPKIIELEPRETKIRSVIFTPSQGGVYSQSIKYRTTWNQVFEILCHGVGYSPPAYFESSRMIFKPMTFGSTSVARIHLLRNQAPIDDKGNQLSSTETREISYQILKPIILGIQGEGETVCNEIPPMNEVDENIIQVWPPKGLIAPQSTANLDIIVQIPSNYVEPPKPKKVEEKLDDKKLVRRDSKHHSKPGAAKKKEDAKLKTEDSITADTVVDNNEVKFSPFQTKLFSYRSPRLIALIPCVTRFRVAPEERALALLAGKVPESGSDTDYDPQGRSRQAFIQIEIPINEVKFHITEPKDKTLNFDFVAVGQIKTRYITIRNLVNSTLQLHCRGLAPEGPFALLKALRPIPPLETTKIAISFQSDDFTTFTNSIEFYSKSTAVTIKLIGTSVLPELKLEPGNQISFGNVCVGDQSSQVIQINNPSPISLEVLISLDSESSNSDASFGTLNFNGKSPFTLSPKRSILAPGSSIELTAKFIPDREHDNFFEWATINVIGMNTKYRILLSGSGWENSTIVTGLEAKPESYMALPFLQSPKQEYEKSLLRFGLALPVDGAKKEKDEIPQEVVLGITKRQEYFGEVSTSWSQVQDDHGHSHWVIDPLEITLANLKPTFKIDQGKKGGIAEYSVDLVEDTFFYDDALQDYIFCPKRLNSNPSNGIILGLEPSKGTIEIGTTKVLTLVKNDPTRSFWNNSADIWKRIKDNTPEPISLGFKSTLIYPKTILVDNDITGAPAQFFKSRVKEYEIKSPMYMEQVLRITFKGSFRFVEPKGQHGPLESRVFYLKVKVNLPK